LVAVLTAGNAPPAFVATLDRVRETLTVRRVTGPAPADGSYELWAIAPGQPPRSLGVIDGPAYSRPLAAPAGELTLAVSLEPIGGSATGAPSGPLVFTGALVAGG
jgi:anti-sigma-K factor RskA